MLFNSYTFLVFLPLSLLLYWSLHRFLKLQNLILVGLSYIFYGWWDYRFLALIIGITWIGYLSGKRISFAQHKGASGKFACTVCIIACLGILGAFKYYDFFVESFNTLMSELGLTLFLPLWRIVLPVGISFYTFQVLSYAIDVYRKKIQACNDWISFSAFVCFFPQLVAGPIERASHLLPQIQQHRSVSYDQVVSGLKLILWGFVKKMLIADRCAPIVNAVYSNPMSDGTDLWMATFLFAFQIYGDFSGYSDIAIGVSRLFGIRLMQNFNMPYLSRSVSEFWRRWHISLMSWFKDYIYIPMGGSRCSKSRHLLNVFVVFTISGLWHGANWTFLCWGVYHSLCFVPLILCPRIQKYFQPSDIPTYRLLPALKDLWQMGLTFSLICIGWVFFRSEQVSAAFVHLYKMFFDVSWHTPYGGLNSLYPIICLVVAEWTMRMHEHPLDFRGTGILRYRLARWSVYYLLIFSVLYWGGNQTAFIYFQF